MEMDLVKETKQEFEDILDYWTENTVDHEYGGFVGCRDENNTLVPQMPKGSVLNARILWTFSAAFRFNKNPKHRDLAQRAYHYLRDKFHDEDFGGVYWTVDFAGNPLDTKKQIYAQAFAIYGLSEYYKISDDREALDLAIKLFKDIEEYAFDPVNSGYFEAFGRRWEEIPDLRLSEKDANEKKTMNTHLHVLEAYTNLYGVWKNERLARQIKNLLSDFQFHFIDKQTHHLVLFMDEKWRSSRKIYSYGHDIEAAWLLLEAAEALEDQALIEVFKEIAIKMAAAAAEGIREDGSLVYENDLDKGHLIEEKHWWVQAEAVVGFLNAWQISGNDKYKTIAEKLWKFIQDHIVDQQNGEWFWGRNKDLSLMSGNDKAGLWKCPYHNSRACLEVIRRMDSRT